MKCSIWAGIAAAALFLGCSDDTELVPEAGVPADAGVQDSGASADVSDADASRPDSFIDLFDVFPLPDGGCPGCIRDRCGAGINACFNNPACVTGLFCTLQMCANGLLGDSGFNPASVACVLGCFNGDQTLAFMALSSFTCLTMTCGGVCSFDAGVAGDARPPTDVTVPDASADVPPDESADTSPPEDVSADSTAPDTGPETDSGDGATPGVDVNNEIGRAHV